jgi:hypothetical protein
MLHVGVRWASSNAVTAEKVSVTYTPYLSGVYFINVVVVRSVAKFAWLERNANIKEGKDI